MLGIFRIIIMSSLILGAKKAQKPKATMPVDNRLKWQAVAPFIKKHFKTDMGVKEIAAELSYQEYLKEKKKDDMWQEFSEVIG